MLCDEPLSFYRISFQVLSNGLHTNILCTVDDDSSKTYDDLKKIMSQTIIPLDMAALSLLQELE